LRRWVLLDEIERRRNERIFEKVARFVPKLREAIKNFKK
jgi:hypothetical protein